MNDLFRKFSVRVAGVIGSPYGFLFALSVVIIWLLTGPLFNYSSTWQLLINTTTTIVTFLVVFLIQNTQNRDAKAMQLKLDELVKSMKGARNSLVNVEEVADEELEKLHKEYKNIHEHYEKELQKRRSHNS